MRDLQLFGVPKAPEQPDKVWMKEGVAGRAGGRAGLRAAHEERDEGRGGAHRHQVGAGRHATGRLRGCMGCRARPKLCSDARLRAAGAL